MWFILLNMILPEQALDNLCALEPAWKRINSWRSSKGESLVLLGFDDSHVRVT
jgi:hypothetical protein